ncbi:MAG: cyclic nucleotide-binding domain-containing protein [Ignavibacteriaceae bacterium]|jgi:CRP-like cAMP-binding protein|nr:cyclic nucleotide-binding domain-containing protein [Ignavibacteriaceae bacterium]MCW8823689.1 cyclic nucleotide-binding domain-containing protein [Ignavibacteriaceae bacterium]MCW9097437.1 cyclic nucleotide-binding domain-containing protein [Ignavibacteriaceae bacterium]
MSEEKKKTIHSSFWANIFNPQKETADLVKVLRTVPLFKSLTKRDIHNFLSIIHHRNYLAGEYIFYQGDPGIGLYIVREGEVEIVRENDKGDKLTLAVIQKGDFFGELALVDGEKRSASAIAKSDTRLSVIFKPDLDEFIEKYPKKGIQILKGIAEITTVRLRTLNEDYFKIRTENKN